MKEKKLVYFAWHLESIADISLGQDSWDPSVE